MSNSYTLQSSLISTERTEEAAKMECPECRHGARCVFSSQPEDQENSILVDTEEDREELIVETVVNCSCDHFECRGQATSVLCGTDGVTYSNECHMRKKACQLQKDIHKVHDGECQPQCELDLCVCVFVSVSVSVCKRGRERESYCTCSIHHTVQW